MKSWITTIFGIAQFVVVIGTQVMALTDGDPSTGMNIEAIMASAAVLGIGINARDNNKTSESAGAN